MTFGSRAKGSRAELEVAEKFRSWWDSLEPGCIFKRTPLSGGWGDKDAREAFRSSGDLMTSAQLFPFCVEIKRRENWSWATILAGRPSPVWAWWKQAIKAADEQKSLPLLIFRKNRQPWSVLVPGNAVFFGPNALMMTDLVTSFPVSMDKELRGAIEPVLMTLDVFFDQAPDSWVQGARGHAAMILRG